MPVYLDNGATTQALPEVISCVADTMSNYYGNPGSFHSLGIKSEKIIRDASNEILSFLHARSGKIYFTSGGTESNNLAIFGSVNLKNVKNIVSSSIEHSSVYDPIKSLEKKGANVTYITPFSDFHISDEDLEKSISEDTNFISIMHVNNESGMIFPLKKISDLRKRKCPNAIFHVDAVQSFGKISINVDDLEIDLLSMSSHKMHGPKGLGALYVSSRITLHPILIGGVTQDGIRPGTPPVELINGFRTAISICNISERYSTIKKLNDYCRAKFNELKNVKINSSSGSCPCIINASILGLKSEVLLNFLSDREIYVSSAAACTGKMRSKTLLSVGFPDKIVDSAIRISFSFMNTFEDIDLLIRGVQDAQNSLVLM